ncbi:MAG: amino acid-binding protein, partial [Lachnospiraceae bacterium]|nr:amino acid-binding protein [Lachnospiraceae bacterium]
GGYHRDSLQNQVNMRAINIAETTDYGVLRLIVDDAAKASSILLEKGFILTMTPVVGVAVPDTPGGLSKVLSVISGAEIDVEYMYSVFGQKDGQACMIFRVADSDGLTAVLEQNGIGTIAGEDLGLH